MNSQPEIRAGLAEHLARLWRYGLILSGNRDAAADLVEATCARALRRPDEFAAGAPLDRRLFSMLRSIWLTARVGRQAPGRGDAPRSTFFEAAEILAVPEATVPSRLATARESLGRLRERPPGTD